MYFIIKMTGGDIEVITFGNKDKYLKGINSKLSYFLKTFSPHSQFAQEPVIYPFNKAHASYTQRQTFSMKIPRSGDLMQQIYLRFELPPIYSSRQYAFRWIPYIGEFICEKYQLRVGPSIIEERNIDLHHIWNECSMSIERYQNYNRMIGHKPALYQPEYTTNNGLYPEGRTGRPSIAGQTIYLPLQFYFTNDSGMAFPLIATQYQEIELRITFRPFSQLYFIQQYNNDGELEFLAPDTSNPKHSIYRFIDPNHKKESKSQIQTDQNVCINYIAVQEMERQFFAQRFLSYIISQSREYREVIQGRTKVRLPFNQPTQEIMWFLRPEDYLTRNGFLEYTDVNGHHMKSARIQVFHKDRVSEKDYAYFNFIQPFQHHTSAPRDGIYMYSFALHPEWDQPTGSWDLGLVQNLELEIEPTDNVRTYEVVVYALTYNRLHFGGGRVQLDW